MLTSQAHLPNSSPSPKSKTLVQTQNYFHPLSEGTGKTCDSCRERSHHPGWRRFSPRSGFHGFATRRRGNAWAGQLVGSLRALVYCDRALKKCPTFPCHRDRETFTFKKKKKSSKPAAPRQHSVVTSDKMGHNKLDELMGKMGTNIDFA